MKYWKATLAILAALSVSLALAQNFTTINGKQYKNATVMRVEPDGIVIKFSGGIVKIYCTELPPAIQKQYGCDPAKAAAAHAAEVAAVQQTNQQLEESNNQRKETEEQKALENRLSQLQQQEQDLRVQIQRAQNAPTAGQQTNADGKELNLLRHGEEESMTMDEKNAQYAARLKYYDGLKQAAARRGTNANDIVPPKWGEADWDPLSRVRGTFGSGNVENAEQAPASEADIQGLRGQLDNVRNEMERVKQELARKAQRQP